MNRSRITPRRARRAVTALAALATLGTMIGGTVSSPASAASLLNAQSTTILGASIAKNGGQIVHTSTTVRLGTNGDGLGLTPSGSVYFTDNRGDNLGTVALPSCLLKPCTVTYDIPISRFSDGVTRLIAKYSGDLILAPSSASVALAFTHCYPNEAGCYATVEQAGAQMDIDTQSTSGYIAANFGGAGLPCGVSGGGPIGHVEAVNLNAGKQINYILVGGTAHAYSVLNDQTGGPDWFCYASPDPFVAYSKDGDSVDFPANSSSFDYLGDAPRMGGPNYSGYYVGLLPYCSVLEDYLDTTETDGPCIEYYSNYQYEGSGSQWYLYVTLRTPPGDPFLGGLKLPAIKLPGLG